MAFLKFLTILGILRCEAIQEMWQRRSVAGRSWISLTICSLFFYLVAYLAGLVIATRAVSQHPPMQTNFERETDEVMAAAKIDFLLLVYDVIWYRNGQQRSGNRWWGLMVLLVIGDLLLCDFTKRLRRLPSFVNEKHIWFVKWKINIVLHNM